MYLSTLSALSQNYQTFIPDKEYYFIGKNTGNINAVFIDSVQIFSDTTFLFSYYTLRNPVDTLTHCYNPQGAPWIGPKVIVTSNGDNLFLNKQGDTILVKSNAILSDNWKMYKFTDGKYIEATVTTIDSMHFLGIYDTIKIITLIVRDQEGNKVESGLNDSKLILSKNNGLIQLPDFYYFPDYQPTDMLFYLSPDTLYCLAGVNNIYNNVRNITARDIFEFNVGDEFHTEYIHMPTGPYTHTKEYLIKKVINKIVSVNNDTITYYFAVCGRKEIKEPSAETEISYQNDTISETYVLTSQDYKMLSYFPDESFFNDEYYEFMDMSVSDNYNKRLIKFFPQVYYAYKYEACYVMEITIPAQPYRFYIEGCGGEYYIGNYDTDWGDHYKLVYFKKGDEIWGTPFDCSYLLTNNEISGSFLMDYSIFPNPADHIVFLRFKNELMQPYDFVLYDCLGRTVKRITINDRETNINVTKLKSSLYFYELRSRDMTKTATGKIVIKKSVD